MKDKIDFRLIHYHIFAVGDDVIVISARKFDRVISHKKTGHDAQKIVHHALFYKQNAASLAPHCALNIRASWATAIRPENRITSLWIVVILAEVPVPYNRQTGATTAAQVGYQLP